MKNATYNNKYFYLVVLILLAWQSNAQTSDFNIQHLQDDVANSGGTNTSFTPVASLNNALSLANNNRKVNAGCNGCSSDLEGDDLSGARQLTGVGTLTYYRESGSVSSNMRFNSTIWEYIGPPGGNNEMIVRGRYAVSLNGSTSSTTQALSGISNASDCIPFITGILNNSTSDDADSGSAIAYLENASTLRVQKGSNANNVTVYITVVEFTGSNWTVLHGDSGSSSGDSGSITLRNGSDGTGTASNVSNWSEAIIFSHHRGDMSNDGTDDAIADNWPVMDPGSNDQTVDWTFHSDHDGSNRHFVHVLNNSNLNVTRFQDTSNSADESIIDITSAGLSNLNEALIVGSSTSSGAGNAYARGWRNYYFNSTSQAAHWSHRSGNTMSHEIQIVDLSGLYTAPVGPEINIKGKGISILDGDTTPSNLDDTDFGTTNVAIPINRTFTIENLGSTNLTISSIILSNPTDFSITGTPYSSPITPSGSTTFTITYNSLSTGTKTSTITITNSDSDESIYNFNIQAASEQNFFDSDGDGVFDNIDIDDDNDGIIDSEEQNSCENSSISISANYKFLNETFGSGNRAMINTTYDATTTYCYEDGISSGCFGGIDLNDGEYTVYYRAADGDGTNDTPTEEVASWADSYWYTGEDHTPGDTNGRMAMFNASYDPGVFYTANITGALPNVPITYSFWVINLDRTDAPGIATRLRPNILVEFRDTSDNVLASITTGDIAPTTAGNSAGDWYQFTADLTFSVDQFNVYFINNETGGLGNDLAIDDIVISQTLCDTDSDGVADVFDLDADNDGIPDVVEAGLGDFSEGKATLTGVGSWLDVNGNGMHDLVEGNITLDSDGDGTPNFLDLDSDNDAIFDVDESGAGNTGNPTYQNGDGDITGDGVGDGPDSDNFRETDVDSDGTIEYYTDGILDIYDYFNGTDYPTSYGNTNQGLGYTYYVLDTDGDGLPDYMDTTSDGSTYDISHTLYASLDGNNDGVIDGPGTVYPNGQIDDAEGDGILDAFDTSDSTFGSPRDLDRKLHLYFDGRNDYADDTNVIDGWSEATLMTWLKIDPSATGTQIITGQDEFYLQLNSDKSITAYADGTTISTGTSLTTNRWTHIAATYSSTNGTFRLYKNGLEVSNTSISGALPSDTSSFTIGREPDTDSKYYHGFIDELRVFEKALSANEIQKMVYQEIENNSTIVRGAIIPRDITDFVNPSTITPLGWSSLKRYFRMDAYKDDIIDDLTTPTIDVGTGAKIYNTKLIDYQNAPLPFVTQSSGSLDTAVNIPADGVYGNDAALYDWSIVRVEHDDVTFNAHQGHLGLIINELDGGSNPIEFHVTNDSELNVSWYLELNGFIDLEGESQLVQGFDSELVVGTSGKIERDQQGTADTYTYNYWSSPVGITDEGNNEYRYTLPQVIKDGTNPASPGIINFLTSGYNGTNTNPIGLADYWIWKFANQLDDDYPSWQHVRSTGTLYAGEGFTMKGPGTGGILTDQNYVFVGKPNNGDIDLTINTGNDYLIGNPYASALDAYTFINDNASSITGTLYFWEHWGGGSHVLSEYQGGYHLLNLSGATTAATIGSNDPDVGNGGTPTKIPGNYIPVSQGFFVVASGTGGTINFNNGQRIFHKESSGNSTFVEMNDEVSENGTPIAYTNQNNNQDLDTRLKLRIGFNSVNTIRRQLLATVDENATSGLDWGYDGKNNDVQIDDMFWLVENERLIIQGTDEINNQTILPIGLFTDDEGLNSIVLDELENAPTDLNVYLHDKTLGIYHNLKDSAYEIHLPAGEYLDRFEVTFSNQETLGVEESIEVNKLDVYYTIAKKSLVLINPQYKEITSIDIVNILGQKIINLTNVSKLNHAEIKLNNLSTGTYIIKLNTHEGTISKKVLVE